MRNDDVEHLLRELPTETAPPDFTNRVLARLDARASRRVRRRTLLAAAAALGIVATLAGGYLVDRYQRRAAERMESLRSEYREMREELDELRALADALEPVLRLGGTDDVEFVFDLRELGSEPELPETERPGTQPVSHDSNPRR